MNLKYKVSISIYDSLMINLFSSPEYTLLLGT